MSAQLTSHENTPNPTQWLPNSVVEHPTTPQLGELGVSRYCAAYTPAWAAQVNAQPTDRFIAIRVAVKDLIILTQKALLSMSDCLS